MSRNALLLAGVLLVTALVHADKAAKCSVTSLATCGKIGCSKPGSPLAVTNSQKRTTTVDGTPTKVTFDDLAALQKDVDDKFANGSITVAGETVNGTRSMTAAPRKIILSGLKAKSGTFTEGNFIELTGFIASTTLGPHPNRGESVNCKLTEASSSDLHINITPNKNQDETQGIVVEMIPQNPNRIHNSWSEDKLKSIQSEQLPVRIQGRLFFDNEHVPNSNRAARNGTNPKRFSVWEIHPITSFEVCTSSTCSDASGWKALENWNPTH
jgi:hypothetical protein